MNYGRKRTYSGGCNNNSNNSSSHNNNNNNNNVPNKKKKKFFLPSKRVFVPPTKFLLGGNIRDPLNLCGLVDEKEDEETTVDDDRSGGLVFGEFLLGGDINDPLNLKSIAIKTNESPLNNDEDDNNNNSKKSADIYDAVDGRINNTVVDNVTADGRDNDNASRKRPASSPPRSDVNEDVISTNKKPEKLRLQIEQRTNSNNSNNNNNNNNNNNRQNVLAKKLERKDKIVSPVIPQPYVPLKNLHYSKHQIITPNIDKNERTPKFKEKNSRFEYGNYNRYYGYRNANNNNNSINNNNNYNDLRLEVLAGRKELFNGKDVLDIGCNIGHISLIVARDFNAKSVIGMDIDRSLINIARKNIKHYVTCSSPYYLQDNRLRPSTGDNDNVDNKNDLNNTTKTIGLKKKCYPVSMSILYGSLDICSTSSNNNESLSSGKSFTKNVSFVIGNYVPDSDDLLSFERAQFDTIICFSMTKWLHLNWGDAGLKRAFKRMFLQLRPGGVLILEPQSWDSYAKKKSLTEKIWRNYHDIQFFPHHFDRYLLSSEVGFSRCETIAVINHQQKGFRRPLKIFIKSPTSSGNCEIDTVNHISTTTTSTITSNTINTVTSKQSEDEFSVNPIGIRRYALGDDCENEPIIGTTTTIEATSSVDEDSSKRALSPTYKNID